jgi:hypothetical protein
MTLCVPPHRALAVLRKPSVGPQLVYRFAPELLAAATQETVDFLVTAGALRLRRRPSVTPRPTGCVRAAQPVAETPPHRATHLHSLLLRPRHTAQRIPTACC